MLMQRLANGEELNLVDAGGIAYWASLGAEQSMVELVTRLVALLRQFLATELIHLCCNGPTLVTACRGVIDAVQVFRVETWAAISLVDGHTLLCLSDCLGPGLAHESVQREAGPIDEVEAGWNWILPNVGAGAAGPDRFW